ncbi:MAG TPA: MraY family glycosyltransferase [Myxococcota bacterium]|nr:MraY family glycosyltransferase [Myxococcota bacterium]
MTLSLLLVFVVAVGVAAASTPIAMWLAHALGAVDRPNERKVNRRADIPLLGGLAVALGLFVGLSLAVEAMELPRSKGHVEAYLIGGMLILALGVVDDRYSLSALPKLAVQLAAAAVAIGFGFQIDHLTDPVSRTPWMFPTWLVWVVTTLWIVGVTNAMNLIDGLDGLCTGVALIITTTLTYIAWQSGLVEGLVVGVVLAGSLLGFLYWNFPPAKIFLGDTGALFIGYCLSLLALEGYQKVTVLTFIVPVLVLAVPIIDTLLSILRRLLRRANPLSADRLHIHHRLLESEGSDRKAVISIYFLTSCFCVIAVSFTRLEGWAALVFLAAVAILTLRLLRNLGFFDTGVGARERTAGAFDPQARARGESR